ncbi:MAG: cell wall hydrolase [Geminicoccaceae bacterium]
MGVSIPASASPPHRSADDLMSGYGQLAERAALRPCPVADLDCRAFTGTLAWHPDERRPLLSSQGLRRLALLRQINAANRERALRCLAVIAWWEARSEGIAGMRAVVAVVLNRARSTAFPDHPCDVVAQNSAFEPLSLRSNQPHAAALRQGHFAPFPRPDNAVDAAALRQAQLLVWNLAQNHELMDPTRGATHFLAPAVMAERGQKLPRWAEIYETTTRIGGHRFYRPPLGVAAEP